MVTQCLQINYNWPNKTDSCRDSHEKCTTQIPCPFEEGYHCFGVYNDINSTDNPVSLGCNRNYQGSPDEKCGKDCVGQPRGKRYYCCCTSHLCNNNFILPSPKTDFLVPRNQEIDSELQPDRPNATWSVIPIIFLVLIFGFAYVYWNKRSNHRNSAHNIEISAGAKNNNNNLKRNKNVVGNLNDSELHQLRNNHDISILVPFNNHFGDETFINDSTHINNNNHHLSSMTNHPQNHHYHSHSHDHEHDANNYNLRQQNHHNDYRLDLNSIKLLEVIGSGRFGTVHRAALNNEQDTEVAVKIITSGEHQSWLNEQQIFKCPRVNHPNILKLLYSDEHIETNSYWLVVDYASKGSLYNFLNDNTVSWKEFLQIALGIVRGLSHLHEADIAHRDFKSKNVLLKQDLTPCITDFGVATILDTSTGSQLDHRKKYLQVGTPRYMAPEVLECSVTFTKASFTKIDVYALSLVLWELISRCHPLPKPTPQNNFKQTYLPDASRVNSPDSQQHETSKEREEINHSADDDTQGDKQSMDGDQPPPYRLPFDDVAGPQPDINKMRQIVVVEKLRPPLRDEWRIYPASELCRAIEDGWEYDHDARISASCFVERVESLPHGI